LRVGDIHDPFGFSDPGGDLPLRPSAGCQLLGFDRTHRELDEARLRGRWEPFAVARDDV
jgi:hypothetical protein